MTWCGSADGGSSRFESGDGDPERGAGHIVKPDGVEEVVDSGSPPCSPQTQSCRPGLVRLPSSTAILTSRPTPSPSMVSTGDTVNTPFVQVGGEHRGLHVVPGDTRQTQDSPRAMDSKDIGSTGFAAVRSDMTPAAAGTATLIASPAPPRPPTPLNPTRGTAPTEKLGIANPLSRSR